MAQDLLFHPISFPLGRMHMGSSCRCSREWWNWRWGRIQARSRFPSPLDHHPWESKCFQTMSANDLFWEVSQQFVILFHLPFSVSHPVSEQTWQIPGPLKLRWKIQAGTEFIYSFYQRVRERGGKKGGEPDCWYAVLCLKSVINRFSPHCGEQANHLGNQLFSWIVSMDVFPGILMAEDVETNCDTERVMKP